MHNGEFHGHLRTKKGKAIEIDGLWALTFGNGTNAGNTTDLFFTAGLNDEADGLYGRISHVDDDNDDD